MAAAYNSNTDVSAWRQCVLEQVTNADFAEHLTHNLLIELYSNVSNNNSDINNTMKVLEMIPRATMLAASQKVIEARTAAERERAACSSCWCRVTRWEVEHDPNACIRYKHPGVLHKDRYTCCGQCYVDMPSSIGCERVYKDHHTVSGPYER
jgi:hypothetical protein